MRRILLAAATACTVLGVASCSDDSAGPRAPLAGQLTIVPSFGALQDGIVEIARGRFVLTRIPGGEVAKDTVVEIAADADSVDLSLTIPVLTTGETFDLTITLVTAAGDTVFRGGPLGVTPSTSGTPVPVEVPFTYVGTGADAAAVQILTPDTTMLTGDSLLLAAQALDGGAAVIPNTPIGWESLDTATVRIVGRDAQYRARAVGGTQRGVARIVATLVTGQRDTMLISNQPLPTAIVAESGNNQSARRDSLLAQPLVARVTAADGLGVAGVWVRFTLTTGNGTVSADSALTDVNGRAAAQYTMGTALAPHVITATIARLIGPSAPFTATLRPEPPAFLTIVAGNAQSAVAGSAVAVAPSVRVTDAQDRPIVGITVTFTVTGGGGIVAGGTPLTDALGIATATSWTLGAVAGVNTLSATVDGLAVPFTATALAGPATQLVLVSGDAQSATVGQTLTAPLVVRASDTNGNPTAGAPIAWQTAQGSLSGDTVITDAAGQAQVTWTLGATAGSQVAQAGIAGSAVGVSFTATGLPGVATQLAVVSGDNQADSVGATLAQPLVVRARDANANAAPGTRIAWATTSGTLGADTVLTDAAGLAQVTWTLGSSVGARTATANIVGTALAQSFMVSVAPGNGARLAFTVEPLATEAGAVITPAPALAVRDRFGNPAPAFTGDVTVALLANPAGATLGGTRTVSASAGTATYPDLTVNAPGTGFTLLATAPGLVPDTSAAFDVISTATSWNAAADFSITSNPNGPWSSGWTASLGSAFNLYPATATGGGFEGWNDPAIINLGTPSFAKNVSTSTVNGVPPGMVTLHPGCNAGEYSELRWTAPSAASYLANVQFFAGDGGNTDAAVLVNNGEPLFRTASTGGNPSYSSFLTLAAGDRIQFAVGTGGDGCFSDNTPVIVTVLATSAVSLTANSATTQSGTVGTAVSAPPSVIVRDGDDNPVAGVTVTFVVTAGGGGLAGPSQVTDQNGVAMVGSWTLGAVAGPNTVTANLPGVSAVSFNATAIAATRVNEWLGGNGSWSDGTKWSLGRAPIPGDTVHVLAAGTYTVALDVDATVDSMAIGGTTGAQTLAQAGNTLTVSGTAAFGANAQYLLSGGSIGGGTFTSAGTMTWTGGTITGVTSLTNSGTLSLSGTGAKTLGSTASLTNTGTILHTGTGSLVLSVGSVVSNGPGALYDFQTDGAIDWVSGTTPEPVVNNQGTIRKSGGAGQSFIDQLQNLGGTLDVQTGELELRSYDGTTNVSTGGTLMVAPGATLDLTSEQDAAHDEGTYQGTYTGSGGGTVLLDNGVLHVGTGATFNLPGAMLQWLGGTITDGVFANAGALTWTGGTLAGTGSLTNSGTMTLAGAGSMTLAAGATLTNTGTVLHTGAGSLVLSVGSVVTNGPSALYEFQSDADIDWVSGTSPEPFVRNQGTIRKSAGTDQSFIDQLELLGGTLDVQTGELELRSYDGTTNVSTGGTFLVAAGAALDLTSEQDAQHDEGTYQGTYTGSGGGTVLLDNGVLHVGTGVTLNLPGAMLQWQAGTIADGSFTNAGTLTLSGASTKTLATGSTLSNAGTVAIEAGTLTINGGFSHGAGAVLQGGGTLDLSGATAVNLFGDVRPGTSPGTLTIAGAYAPGASSTLYIELDGTMAGTQHDQLGVSGAATLGGTLSVTLGFTPSAGQQFTVLTFGSRTGASDFANEVLPDLSGLGLDWQRSFTSTSMVLEVISLAATPGINVWQPGSGVWSDDAKWSRGRAPIPGDTVELTQGLDYQVTLDVSPTIAKLTIGGTGDVISLNVGDQTLTITDAGLDPGLDILPLGSIQVANGTITVNQLINDGSFRTTGTASVVTGSVSNLATWTVAGGNLTVSNGTSYDFQTSGTLRLEAGGTLTFNGAGFLTYLGGTIEGSVDAANVLALLNGAELGLQADLAVDSLTIGLVNARIQGLQTTERLTIGPDAVLSMNGTTLAEVTAVVENQGGIVATGGTSNFLNDSLYVTVDGAVIVNGTGSPTTLTANGVDNRGTISLTGSQQTTFRVTGPGGLTNRSGGAVAVTGSGPFVIDGVLLNEAGGTLDLLGPLTLQRTGLAAQHVNGGTVNVATGDLTVALAGTSPSFTNAGTITVLTPRSLLVSNASSPPGVFTNTATGTINGTGTVNLTGGSPAFSNLGTIAPGLSPGRLAWAGAIPMGATSVLDIELGGTTAGTQYDQLDASGYQITRNGVLNVTLVSGFTPADGNQFIVLRGLRTGQFTAVNLPTVAGITLDTGSTLTTFFITATAGPPPGTEAIWTGESSAIWGDAGNWDTNQVPDDTTNVFVPAGTSQDPILAADGFADTLTLAPGATLTVNSPYRLDLSGSLVAGTTILGTGTVRMTGTNQSLSGTLPNLDILGRTLLSGPTTATGNVDLSLGALVLNGNSLQVGGDFVAGGGFQDTVNLDFGSADGISSVVTVAGAWSPLNNYALSMHEDLDSLVVQGDAALFSPMVTDTALTGGVLVLKGGVDEDGSPGFSADINGTATLVLASAQPVTFYLAQTDLPFPNLVMMGDTVRFGYSGANVLGNLTVAGNAVFDVDGNTVTVSGNLVTQESGRLRMATFGNDDLTVLGNVTFGGGNTLGALTGGVLTVGGDFTQTAATSTTSFAASGTHQVSLTGTGVVSFASPGISTSRFQALSLTGTANTTFNSTTVVTGTLSMPSGSVASISSGAALDINTGLAQSAGATIEGTGTLDVSDFTTDLSRVTLNGDVSPGGSGIIGTLGVAGYMTLGATARFLWDHDGSNTANRDLIAVTGSFQAGGALVGNVIGVNNNLTGYTIVTATVDANDGVFANPDIFSVAYNQNSIVASYPQ